MVVNSSLTLLQIQHLLVDLSVLAADLAQQRRQFLIRRLIARLVQVQSVDGLHQLPGYPDASTNASTKASTNTGATGCIARITGRQTEYSVSDTRRIVPSERRRA